MGSQKNLELCRICIEFSEAEKHFDLFEECNQYMLHQLRKLTGLAISDEKNIPRRICTTCKEDLGNAYKFCQQAEKSEEYFSSKNIDETHNQKTDEIQRFNEIFIPAENNDEFHLKLEFVSENTNDGNISIEDLNKPEAVQKRNTRKKREATKDIQYNTHNFQFKYETESTDGSNISSELHRNDDISFSSLCNKPLSVAKVIQENEEDQTKKPKKLKSYKKVKKIQKDLGEKYMPRNFKSKFQKNKKNKQKTPNIKPKEKQFVCEQCGNCFLSQQSLNTHLRRHFGERPFGCEICSEMYYTQADLSRHMRAKHTGERPFPCRHCERNFVDSSSRVRHERIHTNVRPFPCTICDKAFTNSYIMKNHLLTHTKERAFSCDVCNKLFLRQTHLVTHYRSTTHKNNEEKLANLK